ncbi:hypothetical protein [Myroides odoratus]
MLSMLMHVYRYCYFFFLNLGITAEHKINYKDK